MNNNEEEKIDIRRYGEHGIKNLTRSHTRYQTVERVSYSSRMEINNKITTNPIQNAEEPNIQEFKIQKQKKMKEQQFTDTDVLENQPKSLTDLSRIVQALTKLINDHMNTIQSEIDIIQIKFKLIMEK